MRLFVIQAAFDDFIVGTGNAWYTPAHLNDRLGSADSLAVQAVSTDESGTSPTLTCEIETSCDGRLWGSVATLIASGALDGSVLFGSVGVAEYVFCHFVRLKVTLGGMSPSCRLKLHVCGNGAGRPAPVAVAGQQQQAQMAPRQPPPSASAVARP